MFRIVEDDMPPLPESCSPLLQDFLKQCFRKEPAQRPNAEQLCNHQWLQTHANKVLTSYPNNLPFIHSCHQALRKQDSLPFLHGGSAEYQMSEAARMPPQLEMPDTPGDNSPRPNGFVPPSPSGRRLSSTSRDHDPISPREHSFVRTTFSKCACFLSCI